MAYFELFCETYRNEAQYLKKLGNRASAYLLWRHFKMLVFFFDNRERILKSAKDAGMEKEYYAFLEEFPELKSDKNSDEDCRARPPDNESDPDLWDLE